MADVASPLSATSSGDSDGTSTVHGEGHVTTEMTLLGYWKVACCGIAAQCRGNS